MYQKERDSSLEENGLMEQERAQEDKLGGSDRIEARARQIAKGTVRHSQIWSIFQSKD